MDFFRSLSQFTVELDKVPLIILAIFLTVVVWRVFKGVWKFIVIGGIFLVIINFLGV